MFRLLGRLSHLVVLGSLSLSSLGCPAPTQFKVDLKIAADSGLVDQHTVTSAGTVQLVLGAAVPEGTEVTRVVFLRDGMAQSPELTERSTGTATHPFYHFSVPVSHG